MNSLQEVRYRLEKELLQAGVDAPARESELLICGVLGWDRSFFYLYPHHCLTADEIEIIEQAGIRRSKREPLSYILGTAPFMELSLKVDPRVLIPRPETEELVEKALQELRTRLPGKILDLCTGSGAIALALKAALPAWKVAASDLSSDALSVAKENGRRLGLDVEWRHGDLLHPWKGDSFDVILCNPPYIEESFRDQWSPELEFEPEEALFAGPQGLRIYQRLREEVSPVLIQGGLLWLEIGWNQGRILLEHFQTMGNTELYQDLSGHDRFLRLEVRPSKM